MRMRRRSSSSSRPAGPAWSGCATTGSGSPPASSCWRSRAMRPARSRPSTIWTASGAWGFAGKRCPASPRCRGWSWRAGRGTRPPARGCVSTAGWCRRWSPRGRRSGPRWRCAICSSTSRPAASSCEPPAPSSAMPRMRCAASPSRAPTSRSPSITMPARSSTRAIAWSPGAVSRACWGRSSRQARWSSPSTRGISRCTDSWPRRMRRDPARTFSSSS